MNDFLNWTASRYDRAANSDGTATGFTYRTAMQYYGRPDLRLQITAG